MHLYQVLNCCTTKSGTLSYIKTRKEDDEIITLVEAISIDSDVGSEEMTPCEANMDMPDISEGYM